MPRTARQTPQTGKRNTAGPTDDILIIWNDDGYAVKLRAEFGTENVVTSQGRLEAVDFRARGYAGIALLAELNWGGEDYAKLSGIELAKLVLRARMKLRLPVLFLSFLPLRRLRLNPLGVELLERQIVGAVGHDYIRLPAAPREWRSRLSTMPPMTELQFTDVFNNLCNVKGLVEGAIHKMQGQFREQAGQPVDGRKAEEVFEKGLAEILDLLGGSARGAESRRRLPAEFRRALASGPEAVQDFLSMCGEELKSLVVDEGSPAVRPGAPGRDPLPWETLLLDDEPSSLAPLVKALKSRGVRCHVATSVGEAQTLVAEDEFNRILVAVSDYRLLESEDGVERHQRRQGYDFLYDLASQDRLTHLIALSGLSRKFLLESFQKYNTRVEVYSKQDLNDAGAINIFAETVLDRGQEAYEALCSRPLVGDWRSLRSFYYAHRQANDYIMREREIGERARRFILQFYDLHDGDGARPVPPFADVLDDLTADLAGKSPTLDAKALRAFQNKLVARRIAIWLYLQEGCERDMIYAVLSGHLTPATIYREIERAAIEQSPTDDPNWIDKAKKKAKDKFDLRVTHLLTTRLGLSFPVSSHEMLVEEKRWLEYEMGVKDFGNTLEATEQIHYFVHVGVEKWLEVHADLVERVSAAAKSVVTKTGKPVITSLGHAKEALEAIRAVLPDKEQERHFDGLLKSIITNVGAALPGHESAAEFTRYMSGLFFDGAGVPENIGR
jgi:hypothetical protein